MKPITLDGSCVLTCNWHNWKFRLEDGENLYGGDRLRTYPVEIRGDDIWIDLTEAPFEERRASEVTEVTGLLDDAVRGRLMGVQMAVVTGGPRIGDAESGAVATASRSTGRSRCSARPRSTGCSYNEQWVWSSSVSLGSLGFCPDGQQVATKALAAGAQNRCFGIEEDHPIRCCMDACPPPPPYPLHGPACPSP